MNHGSAVRVKGFLHVHRKLVIVHAIGHWNYDIFDAFALLRPNISEYRKGLGAHRFCFVVISLRKVIEQLFRQYFSISVAVESVLIKR